MMRRQNDVGAPGKDYELGGFRERVRVHDKGVGSQRGITASQGTSTRPGSLSLSRSSRQSHGREYGNQTDRITARAKFTGLHNYPATFSRFKNSKWLHPERLSIIGRGTFDKVDSGCAEWDAAAGQRQRGQRRR